MRTKLTSEQHRFEAGRLIDDSVEWKFVYERTGDFACLAWARVKWLQAKWHQSRQNEAALHEVRKFLSGTGAGRVITLGVDMAKTPDMTAFWEIQSGKYGRIK